MQHFHCLCVTEEICYLLTEQSALALCSADTLLRLLNWLSGLYRISATCSQRTRAVSPSFVLSRYTVTTAQIAERFVQDICYLLPAHQSSQP